MAAAATFMAALNGVERTCSPMPRLVEWTGRCLRSYHRRCELRGALDSVQGGKTFFACHPHGILSVGWISNVIYGSRFHGVAGRCFYLVDQTLRNKGLLMRVIMDAFEGPHGGLRDNQRRTVEKLMERGESISMTPGAFQEASLFQTGKERVVIKERKGFVKCCLRHGYRIHPVYTFGESDTYSAVGGFDDLRLKLNKRGIPAVVFWGLPWLPAAPRPADLLTFVGRPLVLPKRENPSDEEIDEWHRRYVQALQELFDAHKAEAGRPHAVLEVL